MVRLRYCILVLAITSATSRARAEDHSPLPDPDTEIARRHFEAGTNLYDQGKYAEAVAEFQAARRAKPSPAFDYNIGRCHDRLEHLAEAVAGYERYLAAAPIAADADEVRSRITVLKMRLRERSPAGQVAVEPASPVLEPPPPGRHRVATLVVGSAGGALLVGSLVAGLVANSQFGTLKSNCAADGACDVATLPNAQSLIDNGRAAGLASDVLLTVGIAVVVAGAVLFFFEGRRPEQKSARLPRAFGSRSMGVTLEAAP